MWYVFYKLTYKAYSIELGISCRSVVCLLTFSNDISSEAVILSFLFTRTISFQLAIAPYKSLPQEIESLKTVLEMRNDEIQKLRNQNTELAKKVRFQRFQNELH